MVARRRFGPTSSSAAAAAATSTVAADGAADELVSPTSGRAGRVRRWGMSGSVQCGQGERRDRCGERAGPLRACEGGRGVRPVSHFAPARTNSRALSDNSRLIVSDAVEVPVDLRSSFSKLISPAMYQAELRRHVEHVRWYLEHPTEARGLSQSRTTSSARSGHASSTTTCSNSGILHQRSG